MDFRLTPEEETIRQEVERFVREAEIDRTIGERFIKETVRREAEGARRE